MNSGNELFALIRGGDKKAFEVLFKAHYASLCAYANSILSDIDQSQDVVQDLLFKIWETKEQLPVDVPERPYLYRAVQNSCFNILKHHKIREKHKEYVMSESRSNHYDNDFEEPNVLHEKLKKAIDLLPPERRKVFVMHRFEELKYKDIAEKLDISIKTVENQIGKALQFLRKELKDYMPTILVVGLSMIKKYLNL